MATWIKSQVGTLLTLIVLVVGVAVAWGRIDEQCGQIEAKADKEAVYRELDHIQETLFIINGKLDCIIQHEYNIPGTPSL